MKKAPLSLLTIFLMLILLFLIGLLSQTTVQSNSPTLTPTPFDKFTTEDSTNILATQQDGAIHSYVQHDLSPELDVKDKVTIIVQAEKGLEYYFVAPDQAKNTLQLLEGKNKIYAVVPPENLMKYIPQGTPPPIGLLLTPDLSTLETIDCLPETTDGIQRILDTQAELRLPEWIRIVIHTKNHPLYVVSNMSNEPLPSVQIQEYIYHFNDEGLIDKSNSTLTDEQGNILQSSILKSGLARNLETGLEFASEPYPLDINLGIPLRTFGISSPNSTHAGQTITIIEEAQQTIATLTGEEVFSELSPLRGPEGPLVKSVRWTSKYDANSGLPLSTVNFATLEDGTEIVVSEMSYLFDLKFIPTEKLIELLK